MTNLEFYQQEIKDNLAKYRKYNSCEISLYDTLIECYTKHSNITNTYTLYELIDWLKEEYSEPILNKKEKEYLSNVIKPFKQKIMSITKRYLAESDLEMLELVLESLQKHQELEHIYLPYFKEGSMYKSMIQNKKYTVKELGL